MEFLERGVEQHHGVDRRVSRQVFSSPHSAPDFVERLRKDRRVLPKDSAAVPRGAMHLSFLH